MAQASATKGIAAVVAFGAMATGLLVMFLELHHWASARYSLLDAGQNFLGLALTCVWGATMVATVTVYAESKLKRRSDVPP